MGGERDLEKISEEAKRYVGLIKTDIEELDALSNLED